ncbi:MFS transporter [Sphingobium sp. BYY-5]|uniref:MFS transporter n=1 Tax=Sphingobium sp. BYY-5 TaxID=2926400 RepID=UPI001FA7635A|nr:MFS transporter [Sphingobium sp. BYY-5]MCI4591675.1 MFS transporter [Sphingobium sp. BYY-5]
MASFPADLAMSENASVDEPQAGAWNAVYAMALCTFVLVASEFLPVSLLSPIARDLLLSEGQAGQAISISGIFAVVASLSIAIAASRIDRRPVLLVLTALLVVSGALVAFAPSYAVLMSGRALLGIAIGGFWSMSAAIAMRLVPTHLVPRAIAVMNGGNALASTVAAPLGAFAGGLIGWRGAFFCVVPLALLAMFWQARALPSLPVAVQRGGEGHVGIWRLLRRPPIMLGLAGVTLFFMGQFALFTYLRPFVEQVTQVGLASLSVMLLILGVSGFIGTVMIGRFIGPRLHLTLAALPAIMAVTAIGLALFGASPAITAMLLAIWGFAGTAAPVVWWTWITRVAPDDAEAGGGLMVAVVQLAITLGATVGGIIFDAFGPVPEFLGSAAILTLAALMGLVGGWYRTA